MLELPLYSIGVGDRFAHQAIPQLKACQLAGRAGAPVAPVWNKSYREHITIGSKPSDTRKAADAAVKELEYDGPYFVDADHINLTNVDGFMKSCDFFTIDVAEAIGQEATKTEINAFLKKHKELVGPIKAEGLYGSPKLTKAQTSEIAGKYLKAAKSAGEIYRHIEEAKGAGNFVTEVSIDETDEPQSPLELLVILAALSDENIPLQTIAPKFTGRFNKGIDYVGDVDLFEKELNEDIAIVAHAVEEYGLPANLKLSVHSGSDKFMLYPAIRKTLQATGAGLHLKTAGTTWLEELIGMCQAGGQALRLAKDIYIQAYKQRDDLCMPYFAVIDINPALLPLPDEVREWSSAEFVAALQHDPSNREFNRNLRQLLHVGYKVAAQMGNRYLEMLNGCSDAIGRNVTENLYQRHLRPLFID